MLSLHDGLCCIVSYFLFAGPCASWQDFFLSILHFKWSLIMFNHSIFLPCDADLPDSCYLCYYVQIFLFDFAILFHACWFILSLKHLNNHSQWIWPLLRGVEALINIQWVLKKAVILFVPSSLRLSILEAEKLTWSKVWEFCDHSFRTFQVPRQALIALNSSNCLVLSCPSLFCVNSLLLLL